MKKLTNEALRIIIGLYIIVMSIGFILSIIIPNNDINIFNFDFAIKMLIAVTIGYIGGLVLKKYQK